jgi:hypothetical protein
MTGEQGAAKVKAASFDGPFKFRRASANLEGEAGSIPVIVRRWRRLTAFQSA